MKVQLTFKLTAESRDELLNMAKIYRLFREEAEAVVMANMLGPAEKVNTRWLLTPGQWDATSTAKGEPMSESTEPVIEPTTAPIEAELIAPTPAAPPTLELPIPPMDWCSGSVAEFGHIQNLCQELSNRQWNIVQIIPVKGKLVGSEGYGVVAFRPASLRFIDQPPIEQPAESNTPDDRYMGR